VSVEAGIIRRQCEARIELFVAQLRRCEQIRPGSPNFFPIAAQGELKSASGISVFLGASWNAARKSEKRKWKIEKWKIEVAFTASA
jgi:hypothetical protein